MALSYISFLHQNTTEALFETLTHYCLISLFYIKPQPSARPPWRRKYCLISLFYIKPQLVVFAVESMFYCLISLFYIKPQRYARNHVQTQIVLYLFSTSNHNFYLFVAEGRLIVLYLFSTSNHNNNDVVKRFEWLSYISFLHQTTTVLLNLVSNLYCLISLFYIKPQQHQTRWLCQWIILYLFSTSNHNMQAGHVEPVPIVLYLFSTSNHNTGPHTWKWHPIVLYLFSTSNHNMLVEVAYNHRLSYISFLHQTTTYTLHLTHIQVFITHFTCTKWSK